MTTKDTTIWKATFRFPKPKPGGLQIRIPTTVTVEVYAATRDRWEARSAQTRGIKYADVRASSAMQAMREVAYKFEEVITDWVPHGPDGKPLQNIGGAMVGAA